MARPNQRSAALLVAGCALMLLFGCHAASPIDVDAARVVKEVGRRT